MADAAGKLEQARESLAAGRANQAKAAVQRVLRESPRDVEANALMRAILLGQGQFAEALPFARRAHEGATEDPANAMELGRLLAHLGQFAEAEKLLRRAVEDLPERGEGWHGFVAVLLSQQKLAEALGVARAARGRFAMNAAIGQQLATTLLELGRAAEAAEVLGGLLMDHGQNAQLVCNLATVMNYAEGIDAQRIEQAHRNAGRVVGLSRMPKTIAHGKLDAGKRPVRVGFLSADLYSHSVAYFLEPLLEHLDRARFEAVCYATGVTEDETTARLKKHAALWRRVAALSDEAIGKQIAADKIDVLIETSGLTAGHRLGSLLDHPAPVQMTWCGYPNTTGCSFIDVRVVDKVTDPAGAENRCVENLARVDGCFLCYRPDTAAPAVSPLPAEHEGVITFGSFNNFAKVNEGLVRIWAKALNAVPRSRLLLKAAALAEAGTREFITGWFAELGITRERLVLLEPTRGKAEHLAAYGRVDIALDTYPYHGTTTTCEALWMGVPVVTLRGDRHASRVGASLLRAAGLPELVASDEGNFVGIAARLAGDIGALAKIRVGLREKVRGSELCDARGFAERFGCLIEREWRKRTGELQA
ncbi:MAG: tetratricopeptide repeat protein [Phycisphaerales bacterium]